MKVAQGSNPSRLRGRAGVQARRSQACRGVRGSGIDRSHCSCRCHGTRGYPVSIQSLIRLRGQWTCRKAPNIFARRPGQQSELGRNGGQSLGCSASLSPSPGLASCSAWAALWPCCTRLPGGYKHGVRDAVLGEKPQRLIKAIEYTTNTISRKDSLLRESKEEQ